MRGQSSDPPESHPQKQSEVLQRVAFRGSSSLRSLLRYCDYDEACSDTPEAPEVSPTSAPITASTFVPLNVNVRLISAIEYLRIDNILFTHNALVQYCCLRWRLRWPGGIILYVQRRINVKTAG